MKTLHFDHEEFPQPNAEECLTLSIVTKAQLERFARAGYSLPQLFFEWCEWGHSGNFPRDGLTVPFDEFFYQSQIKNHLQHFVPGLALDYREAIVLPVTNTADELEIIIESPKLLIAYFWSTTA